VWWPLKRGGSGTLHRNWEGKKEERICTEELRESRLSEGSAVREMAGDGGGEQVLQKETFVDELHKRRFKRQARKRGNSPLFTTSECTGGRELL